MVAQARKGENKFKIVIRVGNMHANRHVTIENFFLRLGVHQLFNYRMVDRPKTVLMFLALLFE